MKNIFSEKSMGKPVIALLLAVVVTFNLLPADSLLASAKEGEELQEQLDGNPVEEPIGNPVGEPEVTESKAAGEPEAAERGAAGEPEAAERGAAGELKAASSVSEQSVESTAQTIGNSLASNTLVIGDKTYDVTAISEAIYTDDFDLYLASGILNIYLKKDIEGQIVIPASETHRYYDILSRSGAVTVTSAGAPALVADGVSGVIRIRGSLTLRRSDGGEVFSAKSVWNPSTQKSYHPTVRVQGCSVTAEGNMTVHEMRMERSSLIVDGNLQIDYYMRVGGNESQPESVSQLTVNGELSGGGSMYVLNAGLFGGSKVNVGAGGGIPNQYKQRVGLAQSSISSKIGWKATNIVTKNGKTVLRISIPEHFIVGNGDKAWLRYELVGDTGGATIENSELFVPETGGTFTVRAVMDETELFHQESVSKQLTVAANNAPGLEIDVVGRTKASLKIRTTGTQAGRYQMIILEENREPTEEEWNNAVWKDLLNGISPPFDQVVSDNALWIWARAKSQSEVIGNPVMTYVDGYKQAPALSFAAPFTGASFEKTYVVTGASDALNILLRAVASGAPDPTFRWEMQISQTKSGDPLDDAWVAIEDVGNGRQYTIPPIAKKTAERIFYRFIATNSVGEVTSGAFILTLQSGIADITGVSIGRSEGVLRADGETYDIVIHDNPSTLLEDQITVETYNSVVKRKISDTEWKLDVTSEDGNAQKTYTVNITVDGNHRWGTDWVAGETTHAKECTICGIKKTRRHMLQVQQPPATTHRFVQTASMCCKSLWVIRILRRTVSGGGQRITALQSLF
ncbi:MAG: hypothetical protein ACI4DR_09695 [Roseburia sp.]